MTPHVYDVIGTDLGSSFILCLNDAIPMNLQTFCSSYFSPYGGGPDGGSGDSFIIDEFSPYGGGGFSSNETHSDTFRPQGGGLRLDNLGDEEVLDTSADNSFVTPRPTSAWDAANDVLFSDYPFFSPQVGNSYVHVVPPRPTRVWNDDSPQDGSYVHVVPPRPTRVWNDDSPQDGIDYFDDNFTMIEDTEAVSSATFCDIISDDLSPYGGGPQGGSDSSLCLHVVPPRPTRVWGEEFEDFSPHNDFVYDEHAEPEAVSSACLAHIPTVEQIGLPLTHLQSMTGSPRGSLKSMQMGLQLPDELLGDDGVSIAVDCLFEVGGVSDVANDSEGQALWCPSISEYPVCDNGLIDPVAECCEHVNVFLASSIYENNMWQRLDLFMQEGTVISDSISDNWLPIITPYDKDVPLKVCSLAALAECNHERSIDEADEIRIYLDGGYEPISQKCSWSIIILSLVGSSVSVHGSSGGVISFDPLNALFLGESHMSSFSAETYAQIMALMYIRQYLRDVKFSNIPIAIYYDNISAAHVVQGKCATDSNVDLVKFGITLFLSVRGKSIISYHHVKAHSGDPWNEMSDAFCTHFMKDNSSPCLWTIPFGPMTPRKLFALSLAETSVLGSVAESLEIPAHLYENYE